MIKKTRIISLKKQERNHNEKEEMNSDIHVHEQMKISKSRRKGKEEGGPLVSFKSLHPLPLFQDLRGFSL